MYIIMKTPLHCITLAAQTVRGAPYNSYYTPPAAHSYRLFDTKGKQLISSSIESERLFTIATVDQHFIDTATVTSRRYIVHLALPPDNIVFIYALEINNELRLQEQEEVYNHIKG